MLNKEKFAKEIVEIAIDGWGTAVKDGVPVSCNATPCRDCDFFCKGCHDGRFAWGNSEYIEKPVDPGWAVDTKVLVSNDGENWCKRHYAGFNSDSSEQPYKAWMDGKTEWTKCDYWPCEFWKYAELPEDE